MIDLSHERLGSPPLATQVGPSDPGRPSPTWVTVTRVAPVPTQVAVTDLGRFTATWVGVSDLSRLRSTQVALSDLGRLRPTWVGRPRPTSLPTQVGLT